MTRKAFVFVGLMIAIVLSSSPALGDATQMYWLDWDSETLERANVDGSNRQILLSGDLNKPRNVSLDLQAGKMYFCTYDKIGRANLDGSEIELLVFTSTAQHMALDLVGRKLYWSTTSPRAIKRADLDGSLRLQDALGKTEEQAFPPEFVLRHTRVPDRTANLAITGESDPLLGQKIRLLR